MYKVVVYLIVISVAVGVSVGFLQISFADDITSISDLTNKVKDATKDIPLIPQPQLIVIEQTPKMLGEVDDY